MQLEVGMVLEGKVTGITNLARLSSFPAEKLVWYIFQRSPLRL